MKEIKAIVRPHRLDAVLDALHSHPELPGVTVSFVRGFGRTVGRSASAAKAPVQYGTVEMAKLECVVNDDQAPVIVGIIQAAACTHSPGDGKIFVYDVCEAIKIKTGERLQRLE
jgi:nitrogen regulatory protein PII